MGRPFSRMPPINAASEEKVNRIQKEFCKNRVARRARAQNPAFFGAFAASVSQSGYGEEAGNTHNSLVV